MLVKRAFEKVNKMRVPKGWGTKERRCRGVLGLALFPERHYYPTLLKFNG
jgi:hypothetical protein